MKGSDVISDIESYVQFEIDARIKEKSFETLVKKSREYKRHARAFSNSQSRAFSLKRPSESDGGY